MSAIVLVLDLAEGQWPPCAVAVGEEVNPATGPSQGAAWDIDRLEPEGSCRIGTQCQRLCYHHRLPASKGGRVMEGKVGVKGGVKGRDGKTELLPNGRPGF